MNRHLRLFLIVSMVWLLPACGKKYHEVEVESTDVAEADTADVENAATENSSPVNVAEQSPINESANQMSNATTKEVNDTSPLPGVGDSTNETASTTNSNTAPPMSSGTGEMGDYTVRKGDTLMKIAYNVYGDITQWKMIYELNKEILKNANHLHAGGKLKFDKPASEPNIERNGDTYLIKSGDTLGTIADDLYAKKSKWKKLYENNRTLIKDPNKIYAGFYLYYQISEEEKREADEIKARRGSSQGLGSTGVEQNESAPIKSDEAKNSVGLEALKAGGLNSLALPPQLKAERAPSSVKTN